MKRLIDFTVALVALIVASPVLLICALLIRLFIGKPVLFKQTRPGLNAKPFNMVKFRTMTNERDEHGNLLPDEKRLTRLGKLLRSTSLDELPELWNVLNGDMSLVGPRPLLMEYLNYYTKEEETRHKMRPGLTGLAQVSGRNNVKWDERLALDVKYVKEWSIWLDIKILFKTALQVIRSKDVVVVPSSKFGKLSDERNKTK